MVKYTITSPFRVAIGNSHSKIKYFILNLNQYRNAHYFTLNKSKIMYKELISDQIQNLPEFKKIKLEYIMYPKSQREFDISNVGAIVDKYFCDALVEANKLPDDSYKYIDSVTYTFGEIDKQNPRIEIVITVLE